MKALRRLNDYEQAVIYWGNAPAKEVVKLVDKTHPLESHIVVDVALGAATGVESGLCKLECGLAARRKHINPGFLTEVFYALSCGIPQ